ncbi:DUF2147 domain-containing protein [Yoonia sp.]|uniref:DUF2147 domain-containing protein n=1 Tax=Yoonia sp. TaxID=2212373 RepID=UPI001A0ED810|nr:DUF2147 domain-containing protein [Yoonia sp.]MBE0414165.1 DUF2147 domain-containing protein [Yoonia sp.]
MKRLAITTVALLALSAPAFADPLEGMWRTAPDDNGNSGIVQVAPCGAALCGTLVQSFDANGNALTTNNIGRQIISQTVAQGDGAYGGKVWSPDRDKTYGSKLQLTGDTLSVSGCVLGICRDGGTWTRAQ